MISINKLIERSAILLALIRSPKGLEKAKLKEITPDWENHANFFQKKKIQLERKNKKIYLKSQLSFDLYQSIPPEILPDVEKLLWKILVKPKIIDPQSVMQKIFIPKKIDDTQLFSPCINCADAPCMTYNKDEFGATDKFPSLVCPDNLIEFNEDRIVQIDDSKCTGCTLCLIRCPFNSISIEKGIPKILRYTKSEIGKKVIIKEVQIEEKRKITTDILKQISKKPNEVIFKDNLKLILDNFDDKVSNLKQNWDRDKYYVFIRNLFRELGLEATYTGSGGKLRRADVSILNPFFAGIEVKSPAEGDVSVGAIRQAIDAKSEVSETFEIDIDESFCAAIGQGSNRGAHKKAQVNYKTYKAKVPILSGRVLLYLLLKHVTNLPQDPEGDVKRLFTDYIGEIGKQELKDYFNKYFDSRIKQIDIGSGVLLIPKEITKGSKEEIIKKLKELKNSTYSEIDICFDEPIRAMRGSYSH